MYYYNQSFEVKDIKNVKFYFDINCYFGVFDLLLLKLSFDNLTWLVSTIFNLTIKF